MAAIEAGDERAGDRLEAAARWLRGLMALALVNLVVNSAYFLVALYRDIEVFPDNEGGLAVFSWYDYSMFVVPPALAVAAHWPLLRAGSKRLAGLRDGDDRARRVVHRLAYVSAAGLALYAWATVEYLDIGNHADGVAVLHPDIAMPQLASGGVNALGWTGLLSLVAIVVLFTGALAVAVLTRRGRD